MADENQKRYRRRRAVAGLSLLAILALLITAIGSHDDLLTNSPTYQRLHQLQFMDIQEPQTSDLLGLDPTAQFPLLFEQAMSTKVGE